MVTFLGALHFPCQFSFLSNLYIGTVRKQ